MRLFPSVILLASAPLFLAACPGTLDEPERFRIDSGAVLAPPLDSGTTANCDSVVTTLITGTCATAGCHEAGKNAAGSLDLATADVRTRLRNVPSTGDPKYLLINTNAFEQSAIYLKTSDQPPFGGAMPPGQKVDAQTRSCLLDWLKQTPAGGGPTDAGVISDAGGD